MKKETKGMWLGVLGVAIFAVTLPMTRLATGPTEDPQLSAWFITFARAALAGGLSLLFLGMTRSPRPTAAQRKPLLLAMLGNAVGFPLCLGLALRHVSSGHAAVFTALLPLATAALAAWVLHQRARLGFWVCAGLGAAMVVAFSLLRASQHAGGFALEWADLLLLGAILSAAMGYVFGAQVTPQLGAERVICWVCVMALPFSVPGALLNWPSIPIHSSAWLALVYVGVFSMWAGFFAWYRGLAMGGALRVSQVQLLQPFFSILAAVPLLGEVLEPITLGFALGVVAVVFFGKRLASSPAPVLHPAPAAKATP
ncbi:EamA family transporter [Rhodoferax lacus]|uniref:EamA family transporter n=1 Tax=Rhodoferax lacus TaxID=2184758 RepID=A0A3E1R6Z3_9BURK|nr:DMT family transporter [Rhodoferax lacus]RFO94961.1 EamA family transporter [Rhodoferax lacus]